MNQQSKKSPFVSIDTLEFDIFYAMKDFRSLRFYLSHKMRRKVFFYVSLKTLKSLEQFHKTKKAPYRIESFLIITSLAFANVTFTMYIEEDGTWSVVDDIPTVLLVATCLPSSA